MLPVHYMSIFINFNIEGLFVHSHRRICTTSFVAMHLTCSNQLSLHPCNDTPSSQMHSSSCHDWAYPSQKEWTTFEELCLNFDRIQSKAQTFLPSAHRDWIHKVSVFFKMMMSAIFCNAGRNKLIPHEGLVLRPYWEINTINRRTVIQTSSMLCSPSRR